MGAANRKLRPPAALNPVLRPAQTPPPSPMQHPATSTAPPHFPPQTPLENPSKTAVKSHPSSTPHDPRIDDKHVVDNMRSMTWAVRTISPALKIKDSNELLTVLENQQKQHVHHQKTLSLEVDDIEELFAHRRSRHLSSAEIARMFLERKKITGMEMQDAEVKARDSVDTLLRYFNTPHVAAVVAPVKEQVVSIKWL